MKLHPVWNALSHATTIGSAMFIIFFCIDRVNPAMDFLRSNLSRWCLLAYCVMSLFTALCSAVYLFKRSRSGVKHRPSHRQTEEKPVRYAPKQTAYHSRNYGGTDGTPYLSGNREMPILCAKERRPMTQGAVAHSRSRGSHIAFL